MSRLYSQPCSKCGSSDAVTVYDDNSAWCFSCSHYTREYNTDLLSTSNNIYKEKSVHQHLKTTPTTQIEAVNGNYPEMKDRSLSKATAERFHVFTPNDTFYKYGYPIYKNGDHVANHFRLAGDQKGFKREGNWEKAELFGQHLFEPGSAKTVTVCEGYEDAMAAYELTGSKYPCVSVHSAATARKDCVNSYDYLNSFENIVVCFDRDDAKIAPDGTKHYPGQEAAEAVAQVFPAKKVRVLTLQRAKDANDYLKQNLRKEFTSEWWAAPTWTPQGIRLGSDLWDEIKSSSNVESVEYPFAGFNELTYGLRLGELVVLTADTGVGKTSVLKEIEYHLLNTSSYSIGILHLEESNKDTGLGLMSLEANKPLHLPDVRAEVQEEELRKYYDKTVNSDRVIIYDHFGSNDIADLLAKIRHMAAMGAKIIFLDHLSIVVSDQSGDERKQLDEISTKLKTLCMELNICVVAVIHQNRKGEIRGTAGVEQLANIVIKLFREKEADDPFVRNITKCTVQKNRFCGRTGPAAYLQYDPETGRLNELDQTGISQYESGKPNPDMEFWRDQ